MNAPKPTPLQVNVAGIPDALKSERRWVCWRYLWSQREGKQGRWIKLPCETSGRAAKANDASTWTTFEAALAAAPRFDGVGFCLADGWAGIDLDHCRENGVYTAPGVIARIPCYLEVSPSGTGAKAIGRSPRIGGQIDFGVLPVSFTTWINARFFAVTGHGQGDPRVDITELLNEWFAAPVTVSSVKGPRPSFIKEGDTRGTEKIGTFTDDQVVQRILASPQADKFTRLVRGDTSDYGNDHSRADQALVSILAYWCEGNLEQVDRLFRQSGLMRDKWNAASYRRATLAKAVRS